MKIKSQDVIKNNKYQVCFSEAVYITLNKEDIEINCSALEGYGNDVVENEFFKYALIVIDKDPLYSLCFQLRKLLKIYQRSQ